MEVDEKLLKKINRNLRAVKFMLGFMFLMFVVSLSLLGFLAYRVYTFTNDVNSKITNIENSTTQNLDVKSQLCDGATGTLANQFCK